MLTLNSQPSLASRIPKNHVLLWRLKALTGTDFAPPTGFLALTISVCYATKSGLTDHSADNLYNEDEVTVYDEDAEDEDDSADTWSLLCCLFIPDILPDFNPFFFYLAIWLVISLFLLQ